MFSPDGGKPTFKFLLRHIQTFSVRSLVWVETAQVVGFQDTR